MTRHKHADIAEAFGNGKKIQCKSRTGNQEWLDWEYEIYPSFGKHEEWRVAPPEPEALYQWRILALDGGWFVPDRLFADEAAVRAVYCEGRQAIRIDESRWVPPQEDEK